LKRFRRAEITVTFGPLFSLPPDESGNHKQHLATCTALIMGRVAELIPKAYRGVYDREVASPQAVEVGELGRFAAVAVEGGHRVSTRNA
jgi:hypothetical protein